MQAGVLSSSDVEAFTSRVLVNGVKRDHQSWSITRSLEGDLPEQVVVVTGMVQATGTVVWAEGPDLTDRSANPWNSGNGWLPWAGDRVEIYAGDGTTEWLVFTGYVDDTSGDVGDLPQSKLIDDYDRLNTRFSHEPLQRIMPPLARGAADYLAVGLHSLYYIDTALRVAGFYSTPKREAVCALSVPAQSSLWPEAGFMTAGTNGGVSGGSWADTKAAPWGVAMSNFQNVYAPAIASPLSRVVQYTLMVAPDHTGSAFFSGYYSSGTDAILQIGVTSARAVIARWNGVEVCRISMGSATIVTLLVAGNNWILKTNTGASVTGTLTAPSTGSLDRVLIEGDTNSRVAGFQIAYPVPADYHISTTHVPSAHIRWENLQHAGILDAGPVLDNVNVADLLKEIAKATLATMWLDEAGVFQWASSVALKSQAPMKTLTTLDDVRSLSWSDSLRGIRSQVQVDHKVPAITRHRWDNVLVHQGSGGTLESGEQTTDIITPPADTDWVGLSPAFYEFGDVGSVDPMNGGWGSISGATLNDGTTESPGSAYYSFEFSKIGPAAWKIIHTAGTLPTGKKLEMRFPSTSTTIWQRWWKEAFPIIRAFATTKWVPQTYSTEKVSTAGSAQVLVHDCGPWNNRENDTTIVKRIGDYLAAQTSTPQPTITGMEVGFDPRRQLGDVVTLSSPNLLGIEINALVVEIRTQVADAYRQTLGLRIINATSTFTTYAEFEEAHADSLTYEQWRLLFPSTETYDQFYSEPLRGATL